MNLFVKNFQSEFIGGLDALLMEIDQISQQSLWETHGEVKNSPGNLCMHLIGNLNHFLGNQLGKNDYKRDRDFEFNSKGRTKEELIAEIIATKELVSIVFGNIQECELNEEIIFLG